MSAFQNEFTVTSEGNHGSAEMPLMIYEAEFNNGFSLYPHYHKDMELLFIEKGDANFVINGEEFYVEKDDILFINRNQIHMGLAGEKSEAGFSACVFSERMLGDSFGDSLMERYINPILAGSYIYPALLKANDESNPKYSEINLRVNHIGRLLKRTFEEQKIGFEIMCRAYLLEIWALYSEIGVANSGEGKNINIERLQESLKYIENNYSKPISLSELAKICHFSNEHYERIFRSAMQRTPFEYIMEVRLRNSSHLLRDTSASMSEIANACGFSDASYFGKCFLKKYGISPLKYRKAGR